VLDDGVREPREGGGPLPADEASGCASILSRFLPNAFNPELNLEAQLVFVRDADGAVTHAAYRRDGREVWRAARLK
jgi:hypothetical protein